MRVRRTRRLESGEPLSGPRLAAKQQAGLPLDARDPNDQKAFHLLHRIWREWGKGFVGLIWLNLGFIAIFSGVNGLYAPIINYIVDQTTAGVTDNYWILVAVLIVTLVKSGALLAHKRINVRLFTGISLEMQRALYAKMIAADIAWHGREPPAALAQRIMADVGQVRVALERLSRGRTTIVIAHRLSTIMDADQIAVLDRGQLVEIGRHDELLERDGVYASLFRLQFQDVLEAPGAAE